MQGWLFRIDSGMLWHVYRRGSRFHPRQSTQSQPWSIKCIEHNTCTILHMIWQHLFDLFIPRDLVMGPSACKLSRSINHLLSLQQHCHNLLCKLFENDFVISLYAANFECDFLNFELYFTFVAKFCMPAIKNGKVFVYGTLTHKLYIYI